MKKSIILLSVLAMVCHAQTTPTTPSIKGHTLGESVQEFVNNSNATTKHIVQWCSTDQTGFAPLICPNITDILAKPNAVPARLDVHCDTVIVDMLEAFPPSSSPIPTERYAKSWCADFIGDITFENGKLVSIRTEIWSSWSEAYSTLLKKFGKPTAIQTKILQNGFGATFHATNGFWVGKSYTVSARELLNDDLTRYVSLEMETPAYAHEKVQELKKSQKNALD
jgi:hypothetical protein